MVRRSPRRHKVREHGREKPTGGKTDVDEYQRGRDRSTGPGPSAGARAQTRNILLRANDERVARAKAKKAALVAKKKTKKKGHIEAMKRKGGAVLDHALGVEPDEYYGEGEEKAEDKEELL